MAAHNYQPRIVDTLLDEYAAGLPAIAIEGARGVGKTATALRRAATSFRLESELDLTMARADLAALAAFPSPVLLDEWQRLPSVWDAVRRAVDDGAPPGQFILTGSMPPLHQPAHSGAGRIVSLRMRPLSLVERQLTPPTVSLNDLLAGGRPSLSGSSPVTLEAYVEEILASGFPGLRALPQSVREVQLDSYVARILSRDFAEMGLRTRAPATLRRWLTAYAAATSTSATYETIRAIAASGDGVLPARSTTQPYRDALDALYVIDPLDGWTSVRTPIARVSFPPKHHLVDPAIAARLLRVGADDLLGTAPYPAGAALRDGPLLGSLFESLAAQSVRVYAQAARADVGHLRTRSGQHEIDLIVQRGTRVVAMEVKLAPVADDRDVRHLHWLASKIGDELADALVLTTGPHAYRRPDGIGVVPLALLGP